MEPVSINWQAMLFVSALAFAPGIFWLYYFYRRDIKPEPLPLIFKCFVWGMVATVPALYAERLTHISRPADFIVVAPVVEECIKFLVVYLTVYKSPEFDEPMDGVVFAAAAALGFASLENVFYLYEAYSKSVGQLQLVTILRAFFSVPGHALFSIMWGYALGRAKFSEESRGEILIMKGLALAIGFHALFNLLAEQGTLWVMGMIVLIPIMWGAVNRRIAMAELRSPHRSEKAFKAKLREFTAHVVTKVHSTKWYDNRATVIILLFFLFFPAGFYGLWHNTTFSRPEKTCYVVLWALMSGSLFTVMER
jgi:protease PrsW